MKAIYAYIKWLGKNVPKGDQVKGSGIESMEVLAIAASPTKGQIIYTQQCSSCHGNNGEGVKQLSGDYFLYPPLWGAQSYNDGAGMNQLSKLAGFIKNNMPNGVNYHQPKLSKEEAWHVAAYINSHNRPHKDKSKDWPDLSKKPFDYPTGPYVDSFSEQQHQYGPFAPIKSYYKKLETSKN